MDEARLWRLKPQGRLSEFVDCLWIHESYGGAHARERVLPTATVDLVFSHRPDRGVAATVAGPRSESVELDTSQPFSACGAHFKPGGASLFIRAPASEFRDRIVDLDLLWGPMAHSLGAQVWEAPTAEGRLRILEQTLQSRMSSESSGHPAVRYAVTVIERSAGTCPIGAVAGKIGLSSRRFLDLFRAEVGLSPKAFSRMRRFSAALAAIDGTTEVDWTNIALSCGYFDQAHFNHDFRSFCGLTPTQYLRDRASPTHVIVDR